MVDVTNFRQRLDAVLRTRDVKQVSDFLIASDQWDAGSPADPELAMWLMIGGSPALRELHPQARQWLVSHGHDGEAEAVLGKSKVSSPTYSKPAARGVRGGKAVNPSTSYKPKGQGSTRRSGA